MFSCLFACLQTPGVVNYMLQRVRYLCMSFVLGCSYLEILAWSFWALLLWFVRWSRAVLSLALNVAPSVMRTSGGLYPMCHELWILSTWLKKHNPGTGPGPLSLSGAPSPCPVFWHASLICRACDALSALPSHILSSASWLLQCLQTLSSVSSTQWDCWALPQCSLFVYQFGNYLRLGVRVITELIKFISHFPRIIIHCYLISIAFKLSFHIFDLFCCFRLEDEIQSLLLHLSQTQKSGFLVWSPLNLG